MSTKDQQEIKKIFRSKTDVIQINHIMRDIGAIVSEQSPIIANIEREVTEANDHIVAGNDQLNSAASHQVMI